MNLPATAVTPQDLRELASRAVRPDIWDYIEGGSGDERAVRRNVNALKGRAVVPRVCAGIEAPTLDTGLLGVSLNAPIIVAPMAYQALVCAEGERATALGASDTGTLFTLPMLSSLPLESVPATAPWWYQAYWLRDRDHFARHVERACGAGCTGIVLTVDMPRMARRPRDLRSGFGVGIRHTAEDTHAAVPLARSTDARFAPSLCWDDVAWVRERSPVPLVVKGVLHPEDAERAREVGADGLVVSNHGGRQAATAPAALETIECIRETVGPQLPIVIDGAITCGDDIVVALACGANAVMVGRAVLWGLALDGRNGVAWVLRTLGEELAVALHLAGCSTPAEASRLDTVTL